MTVTTPERVVRGQTLFVDIQFLDEDDAVITGLAGATLYLSYEVSGVKTTTSVALTDAGAGSWTTQWDSSVADAGWLFWFAKSSTSPRAAAQGRLIIEANRANPAP